jgi:hypothetical protein
MRRSIIKGLAGAACGAVVMAGGSNAWAIDKYLDLEPAQTLSGYGYGYDSISRTFMLRQCVQFGTALTDEGGGGASGSSAQFSAVTSNDQLADEMGISVGTKFSASMGVASVNASSKVDFFQKTTTNFMTKTILASYTNVDPYKYIAGDINLKAPYLSQVGTAAFRTNCGDYVIIGEQSGRWLYGTVQLTDKDTSTESKLAAAGAIDVTYGAYSGSVNVSTVNAIKQASKTNDLLIRVVSSGTNVMNTTIDSFLSTVNSFPGQNGAKHVYMLKAVPYESIVANWPPSNPLAPLTAEQKLNIIAEAAAGFVALIEDSDFVIHNPNVFALGTTPAKRNARVNYVTQRRSWYQSQLDTMRNNAKSCDVDWNSSAQCENLYEKWQHWEDFAVAEYGQFPVRYTSDCYAPRDAGDLTTTLSSWLNAYAHGGTWTHTRGDSEMKGHPATFQAFLDFKPNFSGGDPLATRGLLAQLNLSLAEIQSDYTTFVWNGSKQVFDLAQQDLSSGAPMTLAQCAYHGSGVKATLVHPSDAGCNGLAALPNGAAQVAACKQSVDSLLHHGILLATTQQNDRTVRFSSNPLGVFRSMTCTVDGDSDNDQRDVACSNMELLSVQLDLINTADLAADAWVAPPNPQSPTTPTGIQINAQRLQILRTLKASKLRPSVMAPHACGKGLTTVAGRCVPLLKR